MHAVAYLVNRYPETTLTAIRREIDAVSTAGVRVFRFAHRRSEQPFADARDRSEADLTEYLASGGFVLLFAAATRAIFTRPLRFLQALCTALGLARSVPRAIAYLALACRLQLRLEECRVSVLHVHFGLTSAVVGLLSRALGGPRWSVTVHGPEEFTAANRARLSRFAASADAMVAISQWTGRALKAAAVPILVEPRIIGMGVGALFLQPPEPIGEDAAVVCIARLDQRKGHSVLLEALTQIELPNRVRIELVGDGPLRAEIEHDIRRRGLDNSVTLRGWLSERAVKDALDGCRFLVLPSLDEGLPVAVMEALARARPVLATNVAGVPELVIANVTGVLVPPHDAPGLALAMRELLEMPIRDLYELGKNGRQLIEERHDATTNARSLIATWRDIGSG